MANCEAEGLTCACETTGCCWLHSTWDIKPGLRQCPECGEEADETWQHWKCPKHYTTGCVGLLVYLDNF